MTRPNSSEGQKTIMRNWKRLCGRAAVGTGIAAAALAAVVTPASAGDDLIKRVDDWGTVSPSGDCVQAQAWTIRVKGLNNALGGERGSLLFPAHYPAIDGEPETNGGKDIIRLPIGVVSALGSRAIGHKVPGSPGLPDVIPAPCHAYAEANGGQVDVGIPYVPPPPLCPFPQPIPGGVAPPDNKCTQMSPVGVNVRAIRQTATAAPGKPVKFTGGAAGGYISFGGVRAINIPDTWPVNFGARIPDDRTQPALAAAMTNEQVTTDSQGRPTVGPDGHYKFDPTASSGYVNGAHATVFGTNVADVTVAHAAVLLDKTKLPAQPCAPGERCRGTR